MKLVRIVSKYLPGSPPDEVFHKADAIYTSLVHLVSITHSMIIQISALPDVHLKNVMQVLGMSESVYRSIKNYLDTIQKYPMYRRQTRDMLLISTLGASIYLIYHGVCSLKPHSQPSGKQREIKEALDVLAMATGNILAMDVYPSFTSYYTMCSMLLMLLKHLFMTFCHLMRLVMQLPPPCREEVWATLGVSQEILENLKRSWLIGGIMMESSDVVDEVV